MYAKLSLFFVFILTGFFLGAWTRGLVAQGMLDQVYSKQEKLTQFDKDFPVSATSTIRKIADEQLESFKIEYNNDREIISLLKLIEARLQKIERKI